MAENKAAMPGNITPASKLGFGGTYQELLEELTQILQEIIGSGDEESLRRFEETIRTIDGNRRKLDRTVH